MIQNNNHKRKEFTGITLQKEELEREALPGPKIPMVDFFPVSSTSDCFFPSLSLIAPSIPDLLFSLRNPSPF